MSRHSVSRCQVLVAVIIVVLSKAVYGIELRGKRQVAPTLTATGPIGPVQDGENVELICVAKDLDVYNQFIKWYRVDNKDNSLLKELSIHNILSANPDHFGIAVARDRHTGEIIYTLTIKGVKKTDDGFYKCAVYDRMTTEELRQQSVEILFPQPIASLSLTVGSATFHSGSELNEVDVEEFDPAMPIICQAFGSNPEPYMNVTIGGIDVTSKFGREDSPNPNGDTYMSVRGFDTDVDSTSGQYMLPLDQAREPIVCKAWQDGEENKALEVRAQLKLKGPLTCASDQFRCHDGEKCISNREKCDGATDCGDGSDEGRNVCKGECKAGTFSCKDGSCVYCGRYCDGTVHCPDKSDEPKDCEKYDCPETCWECNTTGPHMCIPKSFLCDTNSQCQDGSDENPTSCRATATPWPIGCNIEADIMLVIDSSSHISDKDFKLAKELASNIVKDLRVGNNKARIGAMKFNDDSILEFPLDFSYDKTDIIDAIRGMQHTGIGSRAEKSLYELRTVAFREGLGGRASVPDIAIFFTDGKFENPFLVPVETILAANDGIRVYGIGIGDDVNAPGVSLLSPTYTNEYSYVGATHEELGRVQSSILTGICRAYSPCD